MINEVSHSSSVQEYKQKLLKGRGPPTHLYIMTLKLYRSDRLANYSSSNLMKLDLQLPVIYTLAEK